MRKSIKVPPYNCSATLIITPNIGREREKISRQYKLDLEPGDVEGTVIPADFDHYYLLIDPQYLTHNTIAHEIFHLASMITEHRDIHDEETRAWLAGYITEELYLFIEKKKLTVTHGRTTKPIPTENPGVFKRNGQRPQ